MQNFQAIDMQILHCDNDILVAVKPAGVPIQSDMTGDIDMMTSLAEIYGQLWLVHRLDRVVGGVCIFARTQHAAAKLSQAVQAEGDFEKTYLAVIPGELTGEGTYSDLLFHDKRSHRAFVVDRKRKGVKEATLSWRALASEKTEDGMVTLASVTLATGRFHQIRVQFASRKMPLLGDGKYGSRVKCPIALFASRLIITHPTTGRRHVFSATPSYQFPWELFEKDIARKHI